MKAQCPYGPCDQCDQTGFVDVRLADGTYYESVCSNPKCRFIQAGRIDEKDLHGTSDGQCIRCGHMAYWLRVTG